MLGCGAPAPKLPSYLVYVRDRQGSVVAAVDDQGRRVWRSHADLYGLRLSGSGTPVPREFLDRPFDEETGFYQFRYRSYDPATAQWLTPDPALLSDPGRCASEPELCNPYGYAGDRPGEWTDPDGRWVQTKVMSTGVEIHATLGIYGPDAPALAAALQRTAAEQSAGGHVKFYLQIRTYLNKDDVPTSMNKVHADFSNRKSDERSEFIGADSSIEIRADAARPRYRGNTAFHEIGHAAGAKDHYITTTLPDGTEITVNLPGAENDIMANFQAMAHPEITGQDQAEISSPEASLARNQGLQPPGCGEWFPGVPIGDVSSPSAPPSSP